MVIRSGTLPVLVRFLSLVSLFGCASALVVTAPLGPALLYFPIISAIFSFLASWGVGANDVANSFASAFGSNSLSPRSAFIIASVTEFLGAMCGAAVTKTITRDIVNIAAYESEGYSGELQAMTGFLGTDVCTFMWLAITSFLGLPVSTSHTIVGAIVGWGVASKGPAYVHWNTIGMIALSWILSPALAGICAALVYVVLNRLIFHCDRLWVLLGPRILRRVVAVPCSTPLEVDGIVSNGANSACSGTRGSSAPAKPQSSTAPVDAEAGSSAKADGGAADHRSIMEEASTAVPLPVQTGGADALSPSLAAALVVLPLLTLLTCLVLTLFLLTKGLKPIFKDFGVSLTLTANVIIAVALAVLAMVIVIVMLPLHFLRRALCAETVLQWRAHEKHSRDEKVEEVVKEVRAHIHHSFPEGTVMEAQNLTVGLVVNANRGTRLAVVPRSSSMPDMLSIPGGAQWVDSPGTRIDQFPKTFQAAVSDLESNSVEMRDIQVQVPIHSQSCPGPVKIEATQEQEQEHATPEGENSGNSVAASAQSTATNDRSPSIDPSLRASIEQVIQSSMSMTSPTTKKPTGGSTLLSRVGSLAYHASAILPEDVAASLCSILPATSMASPSAIGSQADLAAASVAAAEALPEGFRQKQPAPLVISTTDAIPHLIPCDVVHIVDEARKIAKKKVDEDTPPLGENDIRVNSVFQPLVVITAAMKAFAHGSNDIANAIGPFSMVLHLSTGIEVVDSGLMRAILAWGGIGVVFGVLTYGRNVMMTMGKKVLRLTPFLSYCVEFSAMLVTLIGSWLGLPLSTTHCTVGALIGIALVTNPRKLSLKLLLGVAVGWLTTVPAGAVASAAIYAFLIHLTTWLGEDSSLQSSTVTLTMSNFTTFTALNYSAP